MIALLPATGSRERHGVERGEAISVLGGGHRLPERCGSPSSVILEPVWGSVQGVRWGAMAFISFLKAGFLFHLVTVYLAICGSHNKFPPSFLSHPSCLLSFSNQFLVLWIFLFFSIFSPSLFSLPLILSIFPSFLPPSHPPLFSFLNCYLNLFLSFFFPFPLLFPFLTSVPTFPFFLQYLHGGF